VPVRATCEDADASLTLLDKPGVSEAAGIEVPERDRGVEA
jgi:hypothetical protein